MDARCTVNNTYLFQDSFVDNILRYPFTNILLGQVYPVISIIGIILNILFLTLVVFDKAMRTITNYYLVNLALADLLILVYSLGTSQAMLYTTPLKESKPFLGSNSCLIDFGIKYTLYHVSLFLVTLVSVERFMAICHPLLHRRVAGTRRTVKLCMGCWLVSLVIGILEAHISGNTGFFCVTFETKYPGEALLMQTCTFWIFNRYMQLLDPVVEVIPFVICIIGKSKSKFFLV